jgi:hypothetical protein
MPMGRIDDRLHAKKKIAHLLSMEGGAAALGLWTIANSWCNDELTDGALESYMISRLGPWTTEHADLLVTAKLWRKTNTGYQFHDWSDWNDMRKDVLEKRAKEAAKKGNKRSQERTQRALSRLHSEQSESNGGSDCPPGSPSGTPPGNPAQPAQDSLGESPGESVAPYPYPSLSSKESAVRAIVGQAKPANAQKPRKPRQRTERDDIFDAVKETFERAHKAAHGVPHGLQGSLVSSVVDWMLEMAPEARQAALQGAVDGFFASEHWRAQGKHPFHAFAGAPGSYVKATTVSRPMRQGGMGHLG